MDWNNVTPYATVILSGVMAVAGWFFAKLDNKVDAHIRDTTAKFDGQGKTIQDKVDTLDRNFENAVLLLRNDYTRANKEVSDQLGALRIHVAENYVTNDGLAKAVSNLNVTIERLIKAVEDSAKESRDGFQHINTRIDGKADK